MLLMHEGIMHAWGAYYCHHNSLAFFTINSSTNCSNSPFIQTTNYSNSQLIQTTNYSKSPFIQLANYSKPPFIQTTIYSNLSAPIIQSHLLFKPPFIQSHRLFNSPIIQNHLLFTSPIIQTCRHQIFKVTFCSDGFFGIELSCSAAHALEIRRVLLHRFTLPTRHSELARALTSSEFFKKI